MKNTIDKLTNNSIESLDLTGMYFSEGQIKELASAIALNRSLNNLSFELCNLIDEDFVAISEGILQRTSSLRKLNFKENNLTKNSIPNILKLIKNNKVKSINLSYNEDLTSDETIQSLFIVAKEYNVILLAVDATQNNRLQINNQRLFASKQSESSPVLDQQSRKRSAGGVHGKANTKSKLNR